MVHDDRSILINADPQHPGIARNCTQQPADASVERSDVCAVPAAAVVGESVVAFEVAGAFLDKFGGDSLREIQRNYENYLEQIKNY